MKEYLTQDQIDNSLVILWEAPLEKADNPEHLNEILNDAFDNSDLASYLAEKNIYRHARAIYRNEKTGMYVVATGYDANPDKFYELATKEYFCYVQEAIPQLDIRYICLTTGAKYHQNCAHTDDAQDALLAYDCDCNPGGVMNNYIVVARKAIQRISGNLARGKSFLNKIKSKKAA
tara:strand:+ start:266 stop:793 length:528 start_codon:yes stop_codon:yes gene_type:complete